MLVEDLIVDLAQGGVVADIFVDYMYWSDLVR